jgi:hypothetical protein
MKNIIWISVNKDLSNKNEGPVGSLADVEKIIDQYEAKWENISQYTASEEYQNGDGMDILSQTSFCLYSDTENAKLDINMGDKYQIEFETTKSKSPLLSWMKYKKKHETSSLSELKNIAKNFFELDCESFKNYFNF